MILDVAIQFLHHDLDLGQRHPRAAGDLHEDGLRVGQHLAPVHERVFKGKGEGFVRPVITIRFPKTEKAAAVLAAQGRDQLVEADPDQPRPPNDIDDCAHALADGGVGHGESLVDSGLRQDNVAHSVVLETNHGVGDALQFAQGFHRLRGAAFPFKGKRQGGEGDDERAALMRHLRDERGRARAGPAAEPGADEHHPRAFHRLAQFAGRFLGRVVAQFRIAPRTEAAGDFLADLHFAASRPSWRAIARRY